MKGARARRCKGAEHTDRQRQSQRDADGASKQQFNLNKYTDLNVVQVLNGMFHLYMDYTVFHVFPVCPKTVDTGEDPSKKKRTKYFSIPEKPAGNSAMLSDCTLPHFITTNPCP